MLVEAHPAWRGIFAIRLRLNRDCIVSCLAIYGNSRRSSLQGQGRLSLNVGRRNGEKTCRSKILADLVWASKHLLPRVNHRKAETPNAPRSAAGTAPLLTSELGQRGPTTAAVHTRSSRFQGSCVVTRSVDGMLHRTENASDLMWDVRGSRHIDYQRSSPPRLVPELACNLRARGQS
jgi:hypothetical protein